MSDAGDDDDDDLSLGEDRMKSLRAVWLAMPDEEPPDSGMSALLAAATMKAKEMAPAPALAEPSWFTKFLDVFRRPPVLALATVVVLVGGAVLVNRHEDEVKHESSAVANAERDERGAAAKRDEVGQESAGTSAPGWTWQPGAAGGASTGSAQLATPTTPTTAPMGKPADLQGAGERVRDEQLRAAKPDPKPGAGAPARTPEVKSSGTTGTPKTEVPADSLDNTYAPPPPPTEDVSGTESSPTRAPTTPTTKPTTPVPPRDGRAGGQAPQQDAQPTKPTVTAAQLLTQCQSAAVRGDCAATRTLAGQIQKTNATMYRDKVLRDEHIARCLSHDTSTLAH